MRDIKTVMRGDHQYARSENVSCRLFLQGDMWGRLAGGYKNASEIFPVLEHQPEGVFRPKCVRRGVEGGIGGGQGVLEMQRREAGARRRDRVKTPQRAPPKRRPR